MDFGGGPEGRSDLRPRTLFWFWDVFRPPLGFLNSAGLVDAFIPKLEANRALFPTIATLCNWTRYPNQKHEGSQP